MTFAEIRYFKKCHRKVTHASFTTASAEGYAVPVGWPVISMVSRRGVERFGAPTCQENLTEEESLSFWTSKQETRCGYTKMIPKQINDRRCGSSWVRTHLWNSTEIEVLPNSWYHVSLKSLSKLSPYPLRTEMQLRRTYRYDNYCLPEVFQAWCK